MKSSFRPLATAATSPQLTLAWAARFLLAPFFIWACILHARPVHAQPRPKDDFAVWRADFAREAANEGIPDSVIRIVTPYLEFDPRVVALDQKQPEKTLAYADYLNQNVTPERIQKARKEFSDNQELLNEIEDRYKVPGEVIVALWAMESDFGDHQGDFNTITSLATLAYDGRRRDLFTAELIDALRLIYGYGIQPAAMTGSWAGAMGQCQFMPSSLIRYGVDADGDGKIDIWHSLPDTFASIANYLNQNGWDYEPGIAQPVTLPDDFDPANIDQKIEHPISEWRLVGLKRPSGADLYLSGAVTSVIQPDGPKTQAYLAYGNYHVLMKWNHSSYFALAVAALANKINPQFKAPRS